MDTLEEEAAAESLILAKAFSTTSPTGRMMKRIVESHSWFEGTEKAQQAAELKIKRPESPRQLIARWIIDAVKQTRCQVALRYGRVTISENEYFTCEHRKFW